MPSTFDHKFAKLLASFANLFSGEKTSFWNAERRILCFTVLFFENPSGELENFIKVDLF
jgi:hypothetical protein